MRGSVKKVIPGRGFGFIRSEGGEDVFFHRSGVEGRAFGRMREGTPVEFNIEETDKGPRAVSVRIASRGSGSRAEEYRVAAE